MMMMMMMMIILIIIIIIIIITIINNDQKITAILSLEFFKVVGYGPYFAFVWTKTKSRSIKGKKNEANIYPYSY